MSPDLLAALVTTTVRPLSTLLTVMSVTTLLPMAMKIKMPLVVAEPKKCGNEKFRSLIVKMIIKGE
ncbi:hypothetical protein AZSP09_25950 [Azospira sp. I09]|nr:hypothetical protein AZSP09_25950 [Azospira sp. I09]